MDAFDRKSLVLRKYRTIGNAALVYSRRLKRPVRREELSMCLRGVRLYPTLRELLSEDFGIPVTRLFPVEQKRAA